jgi:hypothetical protein
MFWFFKKCQLFICVFAIARKFTSNCQLFICVFDNGRKCLFYCMLLIWVFLSKEYLWVVCVCWYKRYTFSIFTCKGHPSCVLQHVQYIFLLFMFLELNCLSFYILLICVKFEIKNSLNWKLYLSSIFLYL